MDTRFQPAGSDSCRVTAFAAASSGGVVWPVPLAVGLAAVAGVADLATWVAGAAATLACGRAAFRVLDATAGGLPGGATAGAGPWPTPTGVTAAFEAGTGIGGRSRSARSLRAGPGFASIPGAAYVAVCMTKVTSTTFAIDRLFFSIRPYPASVVRPQRSVES